MFISKLKRGRCVHHRSQLAFFRRLGEALTKFSLSMDEGGKSEMDGGEEDGKGAVQKR